jgi:hypothetical protein
LLSAHVISAHLIEAKASQSDSFLAIEKIVSWERFTQIVAEAEQLARTEDFDYLGFLGDSYPQAVAVEVAHPGRAASRGRRQNPMCHRPAEYGIRLM